MRKLLCLFMLVFVTVCRGQIVTNCPTLNFIDVSNCVYIADEFTNSIVYLPAGTNTWWATNSYGATIIVTNGMQIIGARSVAPGSGNTVINYGILTNTSSKAYEEALFWFQNTYSNQNYRIANIDFETALTNDYNLRDDGMIQFYGNSHGVRVDHCTFNNIRNRDVYFNNWTYGLVDHNTFWGGAYFTDEQAVFIFGDSIGFGQNGNGSYQTAAPLGTTNAVYFEYNNFTNNANPAGPADYAVLDSCNGARWVFRYNNVTNGNLSIHGTDSSGSIRGGRTAEIYGNTFNDPFHLSAIMDYRSGTGVIFSNVCVNYNYLLQLTFDRSGECYVLKWNGADGLNGWDSNDPAGIFAIGTHTGNFNGTTFTNDVLIDSNANWTVNQWVGYAFRNTNVIIPPNLTTTNAVQGLYQTFGECYSNSAHQAYFSGDQIAHDFWWTNGQSYEIRRVVQGLDAPGMGFCALAITNSPSTGFPYPIEGGPAAWRIQSLEPLYQWSNTVVGGGGTTFGADSAVIAPNTNYFDNTVMPGYVPLGVHPLEQFGSIVTNLLFSSSIQSSQSGQSITLTGTFQTNSVTATDNTGTTATYYDNVNTVIGTGSVSAGVATLSISTLTVGTHPLTVAFPAVAGYLATTSSIVNQVVTNLPPSAPSFLFAPVRPIK